MTAALAAALALTAGCSGDGGSDGDDGTDASSGTSAPPTASADTGGSDGSDGGTAAGDGLEGNWLATKDGKAVALVITGKEAGLFSTGGSVCSGSAGESSGTRTIALKCSDGNEDRAAGTVDSVDSTTLKVTWKGFGKETYTRSEGGGLPSGLPTASLGS